MHRSRRPLWILCLSVCFALLAAAAAPAQASEPNLKVHNVFSSNMVLQRDKPIEVWGWAKPGTPVRVRLGDETAEVKAQGEDGRWSARFAAREASVEPIRLVVDTNGKTIVYDNILVGDVWVMNGQSNMAWGLARTLNADLEIAQADLPLIRQLNIKPAEEDDLQQDLDPDSLPNGGWVVCSPETAGQISAVGFAFASRVQRATGVPIGIIDNARGGASLESLVPEHKFVEHPLTKRYYAHLKQRQAEFDIDDAVAKLVAKWEKDVVKKREQGVAQDKLPKKPTAADVRSWAIPGKSPSDAGSCYNGMFGAFIGLNIKGVLFHQGYNNAMSSNCRPKRYRAMMKLMVEGWREDFGDPDLPVGVIGFCAGGIPQTQDNFETWAVAGAPYIREAQRLGLKDVGDPDNTAFLPAFDVQIPGLHPFKKREHGERAARWALNRVYGINVHWETAKLVSAERRGDEMVLTFDQPVMPHDMSTIPQGFSIAGEDGKFYMAHARFKLEKDQGQWNTANKSYDATVVHVWSPLVDQPAAVRYGWAVSAMGNLYVQGKAWAPLASFRTDDWDWPESEDPAEIGVDRGTNRAMQAEAQERNAYRKQQEAERAVEILERLQTLGRPAE